MHRRLLSLPRLRRLLPPGQNTRCMKSTAYEAHENLHAEWQNMQRDLPSVAVQDLLLMWHKSCGDADLLPQVWDAFESTYPHEITPKLVEATCTAFWKHRRTADVISLAEGLDMSKMSPDMADLLIRAHCAEGHIGKAEAVLAASAHADHMTLQSRLVLAHASLHNVDQANVRIRALVKLPAPAWTPQGCRNVMSALNQLRDVDGMFEFFRIMTERGIAPDDFVVASLLAACVATEDIARTERLLHNMDHLTVMAHPILFHACIDAHVLLGQFDAIPPLLQQLDALPPHPATARVLRRLHLAALEAKQFALAASLATATNTWSEQILRLPTNPDLLPIVASHVKSLTSIGDVNAVVVAAMKQHKFALVLDVFLQCPLVPNTKLLIDVADACRALQGPPSHLALPLVDHCETLVHHPDMQLFSRSRVALMHICLFVEAFSLVLELLPDEQTLWDLPMTMAAMHAAFHLGQADTLRSIYAFAPTRDATMTATYASYMNSLPGPTDLTDSVLPLVQAKNYHKALAMVQEMDPPPSTEAWTSFVTLLIDLREWNFAVNASHFCHRPDLVVSIFVAQFKSARAKDLYLPSLRRVVTAVKADAVARDQAKTALAPLLKKKLREGMPWATHVALVRLAIEILEPDTVLRHLPSDAKKWDKEVLQLALVVAARTNTLPAVYRRAPAAIQQDESMQRAYLKHLLEREPIVEVGEVRRTAINLAKRQALAPLHFQVVGAFLRAGRYKDALHLSRCVDEHDALARDACKNFLEDNPHWRDMVDTLAPPLFDNEHVKHTTRALD
ncbi:Aste57867_10160 [Aphanomyces stellatus]|uniref:Aste57867_10160 protein n=1 Tax=Aphanomyces stellatus TaxID=120398 RepID=A0A485KQ67_9STRA|nr:hypothetical protein As57867_010121 [Aphanomyces stellatus]VFT87036.1 Aste57867_10160 [Aphanomyces stellatus]